VLTGKKATVTECSKKAHYLSFIWRPKIECRRNSRFNGLFPGGLWLRKQGCQRFAIELPALLLLLTCHNRIDCLWKQTNDSIKYSVVYIDVNFLSNKISTSYQHFGRISNPKQGSKNYQTSNYDLPREWSKYLHLQMAPQTYLLAYSNLM